MLFSPPRRRQWPSVFRLSGCSSVGRVHVWGACGRTFESCHPDNFGRLLGNREPFLIVNKELRCVSKCGGPEV